MYQLISGRCLSLRHYVNTKAYGPTAESYLIKILKEHQRTGVRALAAEALGYSKSPKVIKPLEEAVGDKAEAPCMQCGNDCVGQYAQQALEKIRKNP
jgi:HEAT repeat protein